jgi:predicted permease
VTGRARVWHRRAFRLLLSAYPRWFREVNAADMEELFLSRLDRTPSARSALRLWARVSADALHTSIALRRRRVATNGIARTGGIAMWRQDLQYGIRTLRRMPLVTAAAILSLGLGVGANTAIFSIFKQMVLRPLPVPSADELVNLSAPGPKPGSLSCGEFGNCDQAFSYPMFRDLERQQAVFSGLAAHRHFAANLAYRGSTLPARGMLVSGSYFPVLGLAPALGRLLGPEDDAAIGQGRVVVLAFSYWATHFGASPAILNEPLVVNGQTLTIVGVAPHGFDGTTLGVQARVFVPISMRGQLVPGFTAFDDRRNYWAYLFGRLKPGVTPAQAQAALDTQYRAIVDQIEAPLQADVSESVMTRFRAKRLLFESGAHGQSSLNDQSRQPLVFLLGVTGLVVLIACANVANLLLARALSRAPEMAVRVSLGATRGSLIRQLLGESLVLALLGGALGLVVASVTLRVLLAAVPAEVSSLLVGRLDAAAIVFATGIAIGAGFLFGFFPALRGSRLGVRSTLAYQSGVVSGGRAAQWFRTGLATMQIVMSMVLLCAAAMFVRSLLNVSRVELGLQPDNVVTFSLSPILSGYSEARARLFVSEVQERLTAMPGVASASAALVPLVNGNSRGHNVSVEGFAAGPDANTAARFNAVGPAYFATAGIRLLAGREFTAADTTGSPKVAIVNEEFGRWFGLGARVVGRRMAIGSQRSLDIEIVGLVQDARYANVAQPVPPVFFVPYQQASNTGSVTFYARMADDVDPASMLGSIVPFVRQFDPDLPVENLRTLEQQIHENTFQHRTIAMLASVLAGLATVLAAIGLYGVVAYTVSLRTREFGLRLALGATPARLRGLVMRQVCWMIAAGLAIGLAMAVGAGLAMSSLLFQLEGHDPWSLGAAAAVLALVALSAGFVPAARAARLDPLRALRYE